MSPAIEQYIGPAIRDALLRLPPNDWRMDSPLVWLLRGVLREFDTLQRQYDGIGLQLEALGAPSGASLLTARAEEQRQKYMQAKERMSAVSQSLRGLGVPGGAAGAVGRAWGQDVPKAQMWERIEGRQVRNLGLKGIAALRAVWDQVTEDGTEAVGGPGVR